MIFVPVIKSSNQNSFGLTGVVFIAEDKSAYELGLNYLNVKRVKLFRPIEVEDFDILTSILGGEIPARLPDVPDEVLRELIGKTDNQTSKDLFLAMLKKK